MVLQGRDAVLVNCSCGCGEGLLFEFVHDQDEPVRCWIYLYAKRWYTQQEHGGHRLRKKLKWLWAVLTNRDHRLCELTLTSEELSEFIQTLQRFEKAA